MKRELSLSDQVLKFSEKILAENGTSLGEAAKIAADVKELSDWFIENPDGFTPWDQDWALRAYFAYYLPLNELRARAVVLEGQAVGFFEGLDTVIDFGAGPGTASFALDGFKSYHLIERSQRLKEALKNQMPQGFVFEKGENPQVDFKKTLFVASYSLTESALPDIAKKSEALMLIEPATHDDGRRLLELRQKLIELGFNAWAPCPHQQACPLYTESRRDWCHDRVHVNRPPWLIDIENKLPFRNQTVTMSYVLMRRKKPPQPEWSRTVGDCVPEKGKDRQLVCRGPQREFLAWLHRNGEAQDIPRGARVIVPGSLPVAGNELRVTEELKIL